MNSILVVDDEQDLCEILQFNFQAEGFEVFTANSAEEALEWLSVHGDRCDLIILDVMMDSMSGFDMANTLRLRGNEIPIIFLTAATSDIDQQKGFSVGGDDYVTKPFSFATVLARVKAVLKRSAKADIRNCIVIDQLVINCSKQVVTVSGHEVELTRKEYLILELLVKHRERYFSRDSIMSRVWSDDVYVGDRSVDVHIARLRKKLGVVGSRIVNKTNFGYAFV